MPDLYLFRDRLLRHRVAVRHRMVRTAKRLWRNRLWNGLIKGGLLLGLGWGLYHQLSGRVEGGVSLGMLGDSIGRGLSGRNGLLMCLVLLLMPVNWLLETYKWQRLSRYFGPMRLRRAVRGVFTGVTLSLFTPNRIGEYGGRLLVVRPEHRIESVIATVVSSFAQLVVLLVMGVLGAVGFVALLGERLPWHPHVAGWHYGVVAVACVLILYAYFRVRTVERWLAGLPWLRRFAQHYTVLRHYDVGELGVALGLSWVRYLVYGLQYYLLVLFFGAEVPMGVAFSAIALIFLIQTGIPLPFVTGLVARGNVALWVWSYVPADGLLVLSATFSLWLINVITPALIGVVFIVRTNLMLYRQGLGAN